jgi:hypothetical protein
MKRIFLALLLATAGCRPDRPPAPTEHESAELNEADAMLNDMAKEEGPEDRSPSPSNSTQ